MASPTYFITTYNKLDEPLYFVLLFGMSSNSSVGGIELKGFGNNGPGTRATSNYFTLFFSSKFFFSI